MARVRTAADGANGVRGPRSGNRKVGTKSNWCAALFLVPLTLLTSHAARATAPSASGVLAASGVSASALHLPKNIHLTPNGRYTRDLCDHSKAHFCLSRLLLPEGWTPDQPVPPRVREGNGGGGGNLGMGPSDVLAAYNIPSGASAGGKIVAVLDGPDSSAASDLAAYRSQFGLPALPTCSGNPTGSLPACFQKVSENGGASSGQDAGEDSDAETALDMQMISAACPDCSILLVEVGDTQGNIQDSDFISGVTTARNLGAVATSISIGGGEYGNDPTGYTTPGHLVLAAAGDFGYDLVDEGGGVSSPSYPASAPDVIAVGGTTLFASGSSYGEAVWNDGSFGTGQNGQDVTTSGCSTEFGALSWQATALSGTGCNKRATADLSAAAAFYSNGQNTDIAVYQGGWQAVEGTSASSPMVAGILTRLGLAETISSNIGWIYTNAAAFNDLGSAAYPVDPSGSTTDSQSPSSCGKLCSAGTGWDGPSGVGTPNGTRLAALSGVSTAPSMDAGGGTTPTPDSGTVVTPTSDGGVSTGTGTGTGGGGMIPGQTTTGGLGDVCSGSGQCISGICAEPSPGQPAVCTETCTLFDAGGSSCFIGFTCTYGYCFATTPPLLSLSPDGGTGGNLDSGGSSGGCAVSPSDEGNWMGLGWLSVGLVVFAHRRRKQRAT
jgi:subtilase family serine protease